MDSINTKRSEVLGSLAGKEIVLDSELWQSINFALHRTHVTFDDVNELILIHVSCTEDNEEPPAPAGSAAP